MIQTNILDKKLKGLNLLIDANDIASPKGSANISVKRKSKRVKLKPFNRYSVTCQKVIM